MISKLYDFNSIDINTNDGVLENIFNIPGTSSTLDLSKYNIETIRRQLFYNNSNIKKVILPEGLKIIESGAFYNCKIEEINIPDSVTDLWSSFLQYSPLRNDEKNWINNIFCKDGWGIRPNNVETINIPNGITKISNSFFNVLDSKIKTLNLGNVRVIGSYAFSSNNLLESITFSNNLEVIKSSAFDNCVSLKNIVLPNSLKLIDTYAFENCTGLLSVIIGDNVSIIEKYAFSGCTSLSTVSIGRNVKYIFSRCFQDCTNLTDLKYNGTMSEWKNINKDYSWNRNMAAKYVQCLDGQVQL